ncbi:MAG: HesA/MoeB/ThiF family protein [Cyclobacteriaceae bacterium]
MKESDSIRYSRQIILDEIGEPGQKTLSKAKVLVIGAGGLGCPVIQSLSAAGVGQIGIVDGDFVETTNLHRQWLFNSSDLGKLKAEVAARAAMNINENVRAIAYAKYLDLELALELFPQYDVIIDGTDNYETRYLTNDIAVIKNKTLVSGAVYKYEGQVSVFNYQDGPTYRCLFPNEKSLGFGCAATGVLGATTAIIGNMMAMETIKVLLSLKNVLSGKMLIYNSLNNQQMISSFDRDPEQVQKAYSIIEKKSVVE